MTIIEHPLKLAQGWSIHVERDNNDPLLLKPLAISKKLINFDNPTYRIATIRAWDVKCGKYGPYLGKSLGWAHN